MTVKTLMKKLEKMPSDAKVYIRGENRLESIDNLKYADDYVYNTTFKSVILNDD